MRHESEHRIEEDLGIEFEVVDGLLTYAEDGEKHRLAALRERLAREQASTGSASAVGDRGVPGVGRRLPRIGDDV